MHDKAISGLDEDFQTLLMSKQSLADVLLNWEICRHCRHVQRPSPDRHCPRCRGVLGSARGFPSVSIRELVDLIQDHYRMELSYFSDTGERIIEDKEPRHHTAVLIFFCTFLECWMAFFLISLMRSQNLRESIIYRRLSDHWSLKHRKEKLFKMLVGKAFGDVRQELSERNRKRGLNYLNYEEIWNSSMQIFKVRNTLVHEGAIYGFPEHL